jgi:hypothetical protein
MLGKYPGEKRKKEKIFMKNCFHSDVCENRSKCTTECPHFVDSHKTFVCPVGLGDNLYWIKSPDPLDNDSTNNFTLSVGTQLNAIKEILITKKGIFIGDGSTVTPSDIPNGSIWSLLTKEEAEKRINEIMSKGLPCKENDTLYIVDLWRHGICECKAKRISVDDNDGECELNIITDNHRSLSLDDFGKSVFLNYEEAKKVLIERCV